MTTAQPTLRPLPSTEPYASTLEVDPQSVKAAMRNFAGGVSVVTAGNGAERTGATVTSATTLSMDPPTMVVNINLKSSTFAAIGRFGHFCVNILSCDQQAVAERFSGFGGMKGADRYQGARWTVLESGAPALIGALAAIDCVVGEIIERHSHAIILGRILKIASGSGQPLVYGQGRYGRFSL